MNKKDHCKRSDCQFYDHKNFKTNCSVSNKHYKNQENCTLFQQKKVEKTG